jgi:glutamate carboxypeptidase
MPLTQSREALLATISDLATEQIEFVIDLSHQNSYSWNKAGTDRVAAMVSDALGGSFPFHDKVRQTSVGDLHLYTNTPEDKSIYILAHLDTVFPPEHPFRECRIEEDRLHGPGAGDMKAGVATVVYAVRALRENGFLARIPLTVLFAGDEEVGAITSRPIYERERSKALACLVVEGAGPRGEVVVSRNGKIGARLASTGRDRHVGAEAAEKASAIVELAHKILALEALNGDFPGLRINVGKIEGGLGPATVPAHASAEVDIRWEDQKIRDPVVEKIREAAARRTLPGCASEITVLNERPAWPHSPRTQWLADLVKGAGREIGLEIGQEHRRGTSDSNFFGAAGIPTVDGIGPICQGYHTSEEFVLIPSIRERTALLANSLLRISDELTGGSPGSGAS